MREQEEIPHASFFDGTSSARRAEPKSFADRVEDHGAHEAAPTLAETAEDRTWPRLAAVVRDAWALFRARTPLSDAVALGREPTEKEEALYVEASDAVDIAAADALAYRPTTLIELREKVALFAGDVGQGLEEARLEALQADIDHLVDSAPAEMRTWIALVEEYEAALAAREAASEAQDRAEEAIEADAPTPPELKTHRGGVYHRPGLVMEDKTLSEERRLELIEVGRTWWPAYQAAVKSHDREGMEQRWNEADERLTEVMCRILETPAPNVEAMAFKARIVVDRALCDRIGMTPDDPSTIGHLLAANDWTKSTFAHLYVDALRLCGSTSPVTTAKPFDCEAFAESFEAKPGFYIDMFGGSAFYEDEGGPIAEVDRAHWDTYGDLKRWEKERLRLWAKERDEDASAWMNAFRGYGELTLVVDEDGSRTLNFNVRWGDRSEAEGLIAELNSQPALKRVVARKARVVDRRPNRPQRDPDEVRLTEAGRDHIERQFARLGLRGDDARDRSAAEPESA